MFRETPDGHEMTSDVLVSGDVLGEIESLQGETTHRFNAIVVRDTTLLEFPPAWLKANVLRHGALALNLLAMLARRTAVVTIEAEHKSTMSAAQQVACFLVRFCALHGHDPQGFDLPYSKTLIASHLGMEVETFSRALARIREHGVSVTGAQVSFSQDVREIDKYICGNCSISGNCREREILMAKLVEPSVLYTA